MTPHSTHLLSLDLVLIKLVNQVAWAGIGHMNTENQEKEEEDAQHRETGQYLGLTHPDNKKNQIFSHKKSAKVWFELFAKFDPRILSEIDKRRSR